MTWKNTSGMPKIKRVVTEVDAAGKPVGRLASQIARMLMGKHRPNYVPHIDSGDVIKVKNVDKAVLTGKKWEQKKFYRTSGRPGGLKETPVKKLREEKPEEVLKHAVKYMLPKNRTQNERMKRLIFVK